MVLTAGPLRPPCRAPVLKDCFLLFEFELVLGLLFCLKLFMFTL